MKYTYLGKSGLKVSKLCLGTMNFGVDTDEKEAYRIMDAALDAGVTFLIRQMCTVA
jgi:aryl-alcohol dehydrogenase-like predicted oxidoreductase